MTSLNQRTKPWITGSALVASAVFLFLQTFILPNVPRIANGDQRIHLSLAAKQGCIGRTPGSLAAAAKIKCAMLLFLEG
jgi:hypothetical protein